MMSFEEFYEALLKFVNFKLFKDLGIEYPLKELNELNLGSNSVFASIQSFILKTQDHLKQKSAAMNPEQQKDVNKSLEQFKNFKFYLNREVPLYSLEFILLSAGCQVGYEGDDSPYPESAEGITHHIVDRSVSTDGEPTNREYIQPQWVYDCLNHSILLPTAHYAPGKVLI
jgi:pescadillo protein